MKFLILLFVVSCALALPRPPHHHRRGIQQSAAARLRRAPAAVAARQRTMLISGYYRPLFAQRRQGFEPETAMTAFAAGENVAAGSYLGTGACATCGERDPELLGAEEPQLDGEVPFEQDPIAPADPAALADPAEPAYPVADYEAEAPAPAPVKPLRTPKVKPTKKVQKQESEENDDDEEAVVPYKGKRPGNSYFPIVFSGYPGSAARAGSAAGGAGGVTAIANSYSTGKGGVANSHATAYGAGAPSRGRKRAPEEDSDDE